MQHANEIVEVPHISRTSFDKVVPFYVVEQPSRACLCDVCYKAKLITIALFDHWPLLHRGATLGSPCTCECDLCRNDGCKEYLPYTSRKSIYSMGKFSDLHMCEKEHLYTTTDGTPVASHRSTCVTGNCPECKAKQDRFFSCPRHKGGPERQLYPVPTTASSSGNATSSSDGPPPGEVSWLMFTDVDERGKATTRRTSHTNDEGGDDLDQEWTPAGNHKPRQRQVRDV